MKVLKPSIERERDKKQAAPKAIITIPHTYSHWQSTSEEDKRLIGTLERWHCLALILVESLVDDVAVLDHDVRLRRIGLERQSVLHPFLIE